ncbi:MAG: MATE family efflux transporter [Clostridia bacterium]|nr:MATE family efflux transporter [Clostridia bacterium]
MNIQLSDHFGYTKLLRFTLPSIAMMVFTSIYGVVDGLFVSNFVGKSEFAAVNFIFPFLMILGTVGFMLGTGGSALIAKTMGEGDKERANSLFSLFIYVALALGVIIAVLSFIFIRPIAMLMGAEGEMLGHCVTYARILILSLPALILQFMFHSFFVTAEKPQLGLYVTVGAGVANMVLDALLTAVFPLGIVGAAVATAMSQVIGGFVPLIYFARKNSSLLRLTKTKFYGKALLKASANGSSELMSNVSMSLVSMLYNIQLINYAGENGVAAYGVLMYVNFVFVSMFIGFAVGSAPVFSFHFGAANTGELKSLLKKSTAINVTASFIMALAAFILAVPLSKVFVGYDAELYEMTVAGFRISAFSYLFSGLAIFGSSFFTALNNGLISATISFLRTLVFQVGAVLILPIILGIDGIWLSIVVAEFIAAAVSVAFIMVMRRKYKY